MLGTNMEVIVILSYPSQLQEEHKDPYVLDKDNKIIQGNVENKSCSKWQKWQDVMVNIAQKSFILKLR